MKLADARVMVTGGAGFLGRRVCDLLMEHGTGDIVVPRRSEYDLTDQVAVNELFSSTRPDVVIHLAAEVGGIGANRAQPGRFFYANMAMGINTIESARRFNVAKFVQVGTVCSYPKHTEVPFREEDLWLGFPEETNAPYGIAKKALLTMLEAYQDQYGMKSIYLIPVNLYGPGDNFDPSTSHVIPALIRKLTNAHELGLESVTAWGTGTATREFLYVDDAARAVVMATETLDTLIPVNIGTANEISIRDLVSTIAEATGFSGSVNWDHTKPDGQPRRMLDTSRAAELFGFASEVGLEEGVSETVNWWRTTGLGTSTDDGSQVSTRERDQGGSSMASSDSGKDRGVNGR